MRALPTEDGRKGLWRLMEMETDGPPLAKGNDEQSFVIWGTSLSRLAVNYELTTEEDRGLRYLC